MSAHTEGRLQAIHGSYLTIVGTDESIGRCGNHGPHVENSRRLAACWNACEFMPTADIEAYCESIGIVMRENGAGHTALVAERDQLRAERSSLHEQTRREMAAHKSATETAERLRGELAAARALLTEIECSFEIDNIGPGLLGRIRALLKGDDNPLTAGDRVRDLANAAVGTATRFGYVLTITQRPLLPLSMGNYDTVVEVRPARVMAEKGGA